MALSGQLLHYSYRVRYFDTQMIDLVPKRKAIIDDHTHELYPISPVQGATTD